MVEDKKARTMKREAAIVQLVLWWLLLIYTVYVIMTKEEKVAEAISNLTMATAVYVYGFLFATFLADSAYKQIIPSLRQ